MVKKKAKKNSSVSSDYKNESKHDQSLCKKPEMTCDFKVSLVHCTDEPDNYYKWIKGCQNVIFVHPSVILALRCDILLVKGKRTSDIFTAYSLKSVKKSTVIMLKDMGFEHEENISIYPFKGDGYEAKNIYVNLQPNIVLTDSIKSLVWKKLNGRFLWPDLKVIFEFYEIKYEIIITKIQSTEKIEVKNPCHNTFCKGNVFEASQLSTCANAYNSMTKCDSHIPFSHMLFNDYSDNENSCNTSRVLSVQVENSAFFTLTYKTKIIFSDEAFSSELKSSQVIENISRLSDEMQSMQKAIDEFFISINQKVSDRHHVLLFVYDSLESEKILELKSACSKHHTEEIIVSNLYYMQHTDLLDEMKRKFRIANKRAPCILLLDKLEDLFAFQDLHSDLLSTLKEFIISSDPRVLIIVSMADSCNCDKNFFDSCFVQEIKAAFLDNEAVIRKILKEIEHSLSPQEIKQCVELFQCLKKEEILSILKYRAKLFSLIRTRNMPKDERERFENIINFGDVKEAVKEKKSKITSLNFTPKKVRWEDIGGTTEVKKQLKDEIELFQLYPESCKEFNYAPTKGILLYGPPGCCKTMIAQALANECNWNFISKKSSDILNMYVGESEKAVTRLFLDARDRAPCIIFLDEIDALAPKRTSCSDVQNRVVAALLTEIAGIETLKDVMVIAATNRPDIVDKALTRDGRLGKHIYVPLPDSESRKEIFKLCLKKRNIANDVDINLLVEKTNGYTGAEIVHLCNEAAMQVLLDDPAGKPSLFTMSHFERAICAVPPRTTKEAIKFYEEFKTSF